jgi:hypothetical protein
MASSRFDWQSLTILSLIAGIIYNSWPLGFILNPAVAHHGLASELAARGQPYHWLFVYGDVFSSLLMLLVAGRILAYNKPFNDKLAVVSLSGIALFCVMASIAALCPVQCVSALRQCPSFTHNPITLLHAIASIMVGFGLLIALTALWLKQRHDRFLTAQFLIYFLFGSYAFMTLFLPGKDILAQNVFIALCSICLAAYPYSFAKAQEHIS